jgi:hypothetical protein
MVQEHRTGEVDEFCQRDRVICCFMRCCGSIPSCFNDIWLLLEENKILSKTKVLN